MTPDNLGPMGRTGSKIPKGYKQFQMQKFTPQQMELFSQMFGNVSPDSFLSQLAGGDQSAFDEMEAPALRQFSALQGNMASRFSGMGTGARRSSGFQNTMNQAASDFAQDLQSKRMQTRMNALQELMSFSNQLLGQQPYETGLVQKQQKPPGFLSQLGSGLGQAIPGAISNLFSGGLSGLGSLFGGGGSSGFSGGQTSSGGYNADLF